MNALYSLSRPPLRFQQMFPLVLLALVYLVSAWSGGLPQLPPAAPQAQPASAGGLSLAFISEGDLSEENGVLHAAGLGGALTFRRAGVTLDLAGGQALEVQFDGASANVRLQPDSPLPGIVNDYRGNDPTRWRTGVPTYAGLIYRQLYPGIDLRYDGGDGRLKGTYTLAPGADPTQIRWRYARARQVTIDAAKGDLRISLPNRSALAEQAPIAWQERGGIRVPVEVRYTVDSDRLGFAVGPYDRTQPLIIDPTLVYGSYFGGSDADRGEDIARDHDGNIYVLASSGSTDFPKAGSRTGVGFDILVMKFNPAGTALIYSTYIGGRNTDTAQSLAINAAGEAIVTGTTASDDFPLKSPLVTVPTQAGGALLKLDAAGKLAFSTFLNIGVYFSDQSVALDSAGNIYITGQVDRGQVALTKVSPDGAQFLFEGGFGGDWEDIGNAITLDDDGNIYITGSTNGATSTDFPTSPDAIQPLCGRQRENPATSCDEDAFVAIISPKFELSYSSYLGGGFTDRGKGIAVDAAGNIVVVGDTNSSDFPTRQAFQGACPDGADTTSNFKLCHSFEGFVTRFSPGGKDIVFSTYLGAIDFSTEVVRDMALDAQGNAYLIGETEGRQFPVKDAVQPALAVAGCGSGGSERLCTDAFVAAFAPDGGLHYSTYLGGKGDEVALGIAVTSAGDAWITGSTFAQDFPIKGGAFQPVKSLKEEGFIASIGAGGMQPPPDDVRKKVYIPLVQR